MKIIGQILELAAPLEPGFHLKIENPPYMALVIEDIQQRGPNGSPLISVAHYGEQNGDLMRDPEMVFEIERNGEQIKMTPTYWRNDYVGKEEFSAIEEDGRRLVVSALQRAHSEFAKMWDANLRAQGFVEAFRRTQ